MKAAAEEVNEYCECMDAFPSDLLRYKSLLLDLKTLQGKFTKQSSAVIKKEALSEVGI